MMQWAWMLWPVSVVACALFFYLLGWEDGAGDERTRPNDWD